MISQKTTDVDHLIVPCGSLVKVVNIRDLPKNWKKDPQYVYIGRPSIFGNPIEKGKKCPVCGAIHEKDGSTLVCYRDYLWAHHAMDTTLVKRIRKECKGKALACWCKPKPCHGDVIHEYLKRLEESKGLRNW